MNVPSRTVPFASYTAVEHWLSGRVLKSKYGLVEELLATGGDFWDLRLLLVFASENSDLKVIGGHYKGKLSAVYRTYQVVGVLSIQAAVMFVLSFVTCFPAPNIGKRSIRSLQ